MVFFGLIYFTKKNVFLLHKLSASRSLLVFFPCKCIFSLGNVLFFPCKCTFSVGDVNPLQGIIWAMTIQRRVKTEPHNCPIAVFAGLLDSRLCWKKQLGKGYKGQTEPKRGLMSKLLQITFRTLKPNYWGSVLE